MVAGVMKRDFFKEYEMLVLLGSGSFGEVWVCREKRTGKSFACKLMEKGTLTGNDAAADSNRRLDMMREIAILKMFQGKHDSIVQLHEVLEGEMTVQVVMELCKGGDLFDLLCKHDKLPEPAARLIFAQLVSGLALCHSKGVLHRDIKPENILFDGPAPELYKYYGDSSHKPPVKAKLADFGLSLILGQVGTATGFCGSRFYTAPEMVRGRSYSFPADVWSMGVVLSVMLTARLPFAGDSSEDQEGLRNAILKGRVGFHQVEWDGVSESAKELVQWMLQVNPEKRPRATDLLSHPWVLELGPDPLEVDSPRGEVDNGLLGFLGTAAGPRQPSNEMEEECTTSCFTPQQGPLVDIPPTPAPGPAEPRDAEENVTTWSKESVLGLLQLRAVEAMGPDSTSREGAGSTTLEEAGSMALVVPLLGGAAEPWASGSSEDRTTQSAGEFAHTPCTTTTSGETESHVPEKDGRGVTQLPCEGAVDVGGEKGCNEPAKGVSGFASVRTAIRRRQEDPASSSAAETAGKQGHSEAAETSLSGGLQPDDERTCNSLADPRLGESEKRTEGAAFAAEVIQTSQLSNAESHTGRKVSPVSWYIDAPALDSSERRSESRPLLSYFGSTDVRIMGNRRLSQQPALRSVVLEETDLDEEMHELAGETARVDSCSEGVEEQEDEDDEDDIEPKTVPRCFTGPLSSHELWSPMGHDGMQKWTGSLFRGLNMPEAQRTLSGHNIETASSCAPLGFSGSLERQRPRQFSGPIGKAGAGACVSIRFSGTLVRQRCASEDGNEYDDEWDESEEDEEEEEGEGEGEGEEEEDSTPPSVSGLVGKATPVSCLSFSRSSEKDRQSSKDSRDGGQERRSPKDMRLGRSPRGSQGFSGGCAGPPPTDSDACAPSPGREGYSLPAEFWPTAGTPTEAGPVGSSAMPDQLARTPSGRGRGRGTRSASIRARPQTAVRGRGVGSESTAWMGLKRPSSAVPASQSHGRIKRHVGEGASVLKKSQTLTSRPAEVKREAGGQEGSAAGGRREGKGAQKEGTGDQRKLSLGMREPGVHFSRIVPLHKHGHSAKGSVPRGGRSSGWWAGEKKGKGMQGIYILDDKGEFSSVAIFHKNSASRTKLTGAPAKPSAAPTTARTLSGTAARGGGKKEGSSYHTKTAGPSPAGSVSPLPRSSVGLMSPLPQGTTGRGREMPDFRATGALDTVKPAGEGAEAAAGSGRGASAVKRPAEAGERMGKGRGRDRGRGRGRGKGKDTRESAKKIDSGIFSLGMAHPKSPRLNAEVPATPRGRGGVGVGARRGSVREPGAPMRGSLSVQLPPALGLGSVSPGPLSLHSVGVKPDLKGQSSPEPHGCGDPGKVGPQGRTQGKRGGAAEGLGEQPSIMTDVGGGGALQRDKSMDGSRRATKTGGIFRAVSISKWHDAEPQVHKGSGNRLGMQGANEEQTLAQGHTMGGRPEDVVCSPSAGQADGELAPVQAQVLDATAEAGDEASGTGSRGAEAGRESLMRSSTPASARPAPGHGNATVRDKSPMPPLHSEKLPEVRETPLPHAVDVRNGRALSRASASAEAERERPSTAQPACVQRRRAPSLMRSNSAEGGGVGEGGAKPMGSSAPRHKLERGGSAPYSSLYGPASRSLHVSMPTGVVEIPAKDAAEGGGWAVVPGGFLPTPGPSLTTSAVPQGTAAGNATGQARQGAAQQLNKDLVLAIAGIFAGTGDSLHPLHLDPPQGGAVSSPRIEAITGFSGAAAARPGSRGQWKASTFWPEELGRSRSRRGGQVPDGQGSEGSTTSTPKAEDKWRREADASSLSSASQGSALGPQECAATAPCLSPKAGRVTPEQSVEGSALSRDRSQLTHRHSRRLVTGNEGFSGSSPQSQASPLPETETAMAQQVPERFVSTHALAISPVASLSRPPQALLSPAGQNEDTMLGACSPEVVLLEQESEEEQAALDEPRAGDMGTVGQGTQDKIPCGDQTRSEDVIELQRMSPSSRKQISGSHTTAVRSSKCEDVRALLHLDESGDPGDSPHFEEVHIQLGDEVLVGVRWTDEDLLLAPVVEAHSSGKPAPSTPTSKAQRAPSKGVKGMKGVMQQVGAAYFYDRGPASRKGMQPTLGLGSKPSPSLRGAPGQVPDNKLDGTSQKPASPKVHAKKAAPHSGLSQWAPVRSLARNQPAKPAAEFRAVALRSKSVKQPTEEVKLVKQRPTMSSVGGKSSQRRAVASAGYSQSLTSCIAAQKA